MSSESDKHIESWRKLRDQADWYIKETLKTHFPRQHGYPSSEYVPSRIQEETFTVGRALLVHKRCDLTIKTIQILMGKHSE